MLLVLPLINPFLFDNFLFPAEYPGCQCLGVLYQTCPRWLSSRQRGVLATGRTGSLQVVTLFLAQVRFPVSAKVVLVGVLVCACEDVTRISPVQS